MRPNYVGIICAEGDLWHDQRKFVAKSLRTIGVTKHDNPSRERLQHDILAEVNDFVQFLGKSGGPLDPLVALRHNVGAVVCKLVFGKSWPRDDALWQWLQHTQEEGLKHIGVAGPLNFLPFLRFIPLFSRTMKFLLNGKQVSHSVYKKIISDRCATDIDESALRNFLEAFVVERKKIASDAIASSFYSDVQFHHLLADLFGAGLDTTLVTLRWYLLYMARNITIQQQVQSEIDNHCKARQLVLADQADLPFTVASIMEAQRIRSVTPLGIPHGSLEPVVGIEGTRYEIPAGAMIVPLQWAVHMDPHQWPNPEQFDPTRFLDPDNQSTIRDYFIPFQTGKRMCVGDELARMILFLFAAGTVQRFTISIAEPAEVDMDGECGITLSPLPCMLNFEERDGL